MVSRNKRIQDLDEKSILADTDYFVIDDSEDTNPLTRTKKTKV